MISPTENGEADAHVAAITRSISEFGVGLYAGLTAATTNNLVLSPLSLCTGLAMTYAGARGRTETQIARTLRLTIDPATVHQAFASLAARLSDIRGRDSTAFRTANGLWPQAGYPLLEEFRVLLQTHYGAAVQAVDYRKTEEARAEINRWVKDRTAGRISDMVGPGVLGPDTRLLLTNAIYFKGTWAKPFDPHRTVCAPFWITDRETIEVPTMSQAARLGYFEQDHLQLLELPYGDDLSMVVALPKERNGLAALERTLTAATIGRWTKRLVPRRVAVNLPRFHVESTFSLRDSLRSMGMTDAFDVHEADFSAMAGRESSLFLSDVVHKVFVDVNEEGTEAAAATAPVMRVRLASQPIPTFRADHPFVFWIRDTRTNSIVFLGRVVSPVA